MPALARLCESCQQVQPANKFLPSSLSPTGYLTKCLDCIRKTSEEHRIERMRIAEAAEQRKRTDLGALVPTSQPIDLANVRPVGRRLPPELFEAARRFVFDFRDGHTDAIANEIEPELYGLLEWLAQQSILTAENRRPPEEIGRGILGYRDNNTSRGVAYGALWAALVRAAAVYSRDEGRMIDGARPCESSGWQQGRRAQVAWTLHDNQHHHVSPHYLYQYATHAAWLEDHRRLGNGALARRALGLALRHPVSRNWKGYWQRNVG
jgi:hypothetical protein